MTLFVAALALGVAVAALVVACIAVARTLR
jgi:hypothetical protein